MLNYSVSFRIPFTVFGRTQYVNGAFCSPVRAAPGEKVLVSGPNASAVQAEVIQSSQTTRSPDTFAWVEITA